MKPYDPRFQAKAEHVTWLNEHNQQRIDELTAAVNTRPAAPARPAPVQRRRQSAIKESFDGLTESEWAQLANKSMPVPEDLSRFSTEQLVAEMGKYLLASCIFDPRWDFPGAFSYTPTTGQTNGVQ